jgi:V/A-type H+-transporting ATPase subunit B
MAILSPTARRLARYTQVVSIVGDILAIRASDVGLGDLAVVENWDGENSIAQAVEVRGDEVYLQVFAGGKGLSTTTKVRFLGHPM